MVHAPSRVLRLASPNTKGEDVRRLQIAINARRRAHHIAVDGQYGPTTAHEAKVTALALGIASGGVNNGLGKHAQTIIRAPGRRTPLEHYRAKARARAAAKRAAQHGTGGEAAVKVALDWCYNHPQREVPAGSNRGPQIDVWERGVQMLGQPWCGAFVHGCILQATGINIDGDMRYCPNIEAHAKAGTGGWKEWIPASRISDAPVGAVLLWGSAEADHQSFLVSKVPFGATSVKDAGGNTSSGDGSQSDGGMTAAKTRPVGGSFPLRGAAVWRGI